MNINIIVYNCSSRLPTPPPKHMRLVPAPTAPNKLLQRQGRYLFGQFFLHSSTNFACPPQQNFSRPNSEQALTDFDLGTWIKQAEKNSFAKECGSVEEHSVAPASQLRARDSPTLVQKAVLRVGLIKGLDSVRYGSYARESRKASPESRGNIGRLGTNKRHDRFATSLALRSAPYLP